MRSVGANWWGQVTKDEYGDLEITREEKTRFQRLMKQKICEE